MPNWEGEYRHHVGETDVLHHLVRIVEGIAFIFVPRTWGNLYGALMITIIVIKEEVRNRRDYEARWDEFH